MKYRVTDLRPEAENDFDIIVDSARSPEDAAHRALALEVVRSGAKVNLVARVSWESIGRSDNYIELYRKSS